MQKYLVLLLVFFTGFSEPITAQEADEKIGNLINQSDWFALESEYPKLKDEMQSEMLKYLSEAMIGFYFNQSQNSIQAIDWLIENAQDELGLSNISNLILIKSILLGEQGLYTESTDFLSSFLTQVSQFADIIDFSRHNNTLAFYEKMRGEAKPEVIRPARDVEVPLIIEDITRGQIMYIPVNRNGKEYKFIFDTGAGTTFVSEHFAKEMDIRIIEDSTNIIGAVHSATGKRGIIDSLVIGDIVFKNPIVTISLPNEGVDSIFQVDAIIGLDFMKMIGEVQIYPQEKKIIFPLQKTELPSFGRNLMLQNAMSPYLKMYSNDEKLLFVFDTGNVKTDLSHSYYEKHKDYLDKTETKRTVRRGGFGGIRFFDAYQLPKFQLTIGDCNFELSDVDVVLDEDYNKDGNLGMDFITLFKKVILNFDDMFVKVEK